MVKIKEAVVLSSLLLLGACQGSSQKTADSNQIADKAEIESMLSIPLPSEIENLRYEVQAQGLDTYALVSFQTPPEYFEDQITSITTPYHEATAEADLANFEHGTSFSQDFMKLPATNDQVRVKLTNLAPKYFWYQNGTLYFMFVERDL